MAQWCKLDLTDAGATDRKVREWAPDLIFHLAAQSSVRAAWDDPLVTLTNNVQAQYNVLRAAQRHRIQRVVVASSSDVYGNVEPDDSPVKETAPLRPINPYGLSKCAQDLMAYQFAIAEGLAVMSARPFLELGPHRSDRFAAGSFGRQIAEIAAGRRPPTIRAGDIGLRRDFTHVKDVARAYLVIAKRGRPGEAYNVASGQAHELSELIRAMMSEARVEAQIECDETLLRRQEPKVMVGDASKLRALAWGPRIGFEQAAADTVRYWLDRVAGHTAT